MCLVEEGILHVLCHNPTIYIAQGGKKGDGRDKYFLVCKKKKPVDFDDELRIGGVRYDNMI